ncbi:transcription elongation factor GreA [Candidatus Falkowbacteria bacterium]|nr:transcription elongation factor GreA [Candidatus Falkowbacteria bacterium]
MTNQIITQEGYDKLKKELDYLVNVKRKEIAERIQRAKDQGDLSENAEYAEAKDAQAFNEGRIAELSALIKNLTIVGNGSGKDKVSMGSKVTVEAGGEKKIFTIVSFNEADPLAGKISNESPIGRALLDKKIGDMVVVNTPKGEIKYRIVKIE